MYSQLVEKILREITYNGIMRKQASIGRLFPTFPSRVRAVAAQGGVTLVEKMPDTWHFKVPSSKGDGVKYDVYVRFRNIEEMIKKYASDKRLWNKAGTRVNFTLLASEVLNSVDIETDCACPADLYYGGEYLKTQRKAQYDHEENRPPDVRNPKQYGIMCKHGELVFEVLPMYTTTFAEFLRMYWVDVVDNAVDAATKDMSGFRKAADELGQREKEQFDKKKAGGRRGAAGETPTKEEIPTAEPGEDEEVPTGEPIDSEDLGVAPDEPGTKTGKQTTKQGTKPKSKTGSSPTRPGTKPIGQGNKSATKPTLKRGTR